MRVCDKCKIKDIDSEYPIDRFKLDIYFGSLDVRTLYQLEFELCLDCAERYSIKIGNCIKGLPSLQGIISRKRVKE